MMARGQATRMTIVAAAIAYTVLGVGLAQIANAATSLRLRELWRLAAWVASGAVFAAQIGHEHFRLGNRAASTALHCAMAAALGAFGLAVFATARSFLVSPEAAHWRFGIALVAWPVVTAVPAFVVALAAAAALRRVRPAH